MEESQAVYTVIIGAGALIAVVAPILKLNSSIVQLNTTLEHTNNDMAVQKDRVTKHGKEIEDLEDRAKDLEHGIRDHEKRLTSIEEKERR